MPWQTSRHLHVSLGRPTKNVGAPDSGGDHDIKQKKTHLPYITACPHVSLSARGMECGSAGSEAFRMRPGGTSKAWCAVLAARAKLLGEVVQVLEYLSNYVTRRNFGVADVSLKYLMVCSSSSASMSRAVQSLPGGLLLAWKPRHIRTHLSCG